MNFNLYFVHPIGSADSFHWKFIFRRCQLIGWWRISFNFFFFGTCSLTAVKYSPAFINDNWIQYVRFLVLQSLSTRYVLILFYTNAEVFQVSPPTEYSNQNVLFVHSKHDSYIPSTPLLLIRPKISTCASFTDIISALLGCRHISVTTFDWGPHVLLWSNSIWNLWWTMALGRVFVRVFRFSLVSVISPIVYLFTYHRRCLISAADDVYV